VPVLTVFAGPNGSGKSSIIPSFQIEGKDRLLDTDAIAKGINCSDPGQAAVAAGREVILRMREYIRERESFAIETTLAGCGTVAAIKSASEAGFALRLVYICLDNPERCIRRVQERAAQGGHDVADADVRRRYVRSLTNLPKVLHFVTQAVVYDNSGPEPQRMIEVQDGTITWQATNQSLWVRQLVEAMK
jgi:predicted ABC-type ATPase